MFSQDGRIIRKLQEDAALMEQELIADVAGTIAPHGLERLARGLVMQGRTLPPARVSWQSEARLRFAVKGVDPQWLTDVQRLLPQPDLTLLLDIAPETAVARKAAGRDKYESDLALLTRVRSAYRQLATAPTWTLIDGEQSREAVATAINAIVATQLARP